MNMMKRASWRESNRVLAGIYPDEHAARQIAARLIASGYQMDLIAVLARGRTLGDDPLGICGKPLSRQISARGKTGLSWGGFGGLLAGTVAFFVYPGITPSEAAGILAVATAGGTLLGAGAMAIGAMLSQLAIGFHRAGVPAEKFLALQDAMEHGKSVVTLRGAESEVPRWKEVLESGNPSAVFDFPYLRVIDKKLWLRFARA